MLFTLAPTAHVLLPTREVEQAWIVAQGKASLGLATALLGQADLAHGALLALAACDQRAFGAWPQTGTVVEVSQFVQNGGQQLLAHGAMGAVGALCRGAAIHQLG
ncbi:hypothetical protein D3C81_878970 [compost metagenome]